MDALTLFGLASVTAMLACYWLEERSVWAVLGFAIASWSAAIYGWLIGSWPFAIVEAVWGAVALRRYLRRSGRYI